MASSESTNTKFPIRGPREGSLRVGFLLAAAWALGATINTPPAFSALISLVYVATKLRAIDYKYHLVSWTILSDQSCQILL